MAEKRVFRSKKKVSGGGLYRKWSDWQEEDYVIGKYVKSGEDQYGNPSWSLTIYDAEMSDKKFAKSILEKTLILNSAGQLNKAMEEIELGEIVKVTYKGTSKIEKGKYKGKEAHLHDVEIMHEDGAEEEVNEEDDL